MLTLLSAIGGNKLWWKIVVIGAILLAVLGFIVATFSAGRKSASADAAIGVIKSIQQASKVRQQVESIKSEDARRKLKQRWSRG